MIDISSLMVQVSNLWEESSRGTEPVYVQIGTKKVPLDSIGCDYDVASGRRVIVLRAEEA